MEGLLVTRAHRLLAVLAVAGVVALLSTGCAADDSDGQGSQDATAASLPGSDDATAAEDPTPGDGLSVAAPVYPLAWLAAEVAPGAEVELLTSAGEDAHDVELSPQYRELIETTDLVLYMGELDYQPQVESAVQSAAGEVVAFTDAVDAGSLRTWDDEPGVDSGRGDDQDGEEHGAYDPHAWFDAGAMAELAVAVGEAYAQIDPSGAEAYAENAEWLRETLVALDEEIAAMLGDRCAHDHVVVSHEAYAYLLEPHGHEQEGVSGAGGHGPASPQRLAELADHITAEGIRYVLSEPIEGREDAEAVAEEAGVDLLDIYSLEVVDDEEHFAGRGFPELLREQAETMATALSCG